MGLNVHEWTDLSRLFEVPVGCHTLGAVFIVILYYTPHAHLVVYHVDFHGATSHMGIHVVNHGRKTTW